MNSNAFNPHDDLMTALRKLWPETFSNPFNDYQRDLIEKLERIIVTGGNETFDGERAGGNTSILGCSAIWSVLRGHHRFVMFVHGSLKMLSWVRHHAEVARAAMPDMGPTELPGDPRYIIRMGAGQGIAVVPNMTGHQEIGLPSLLLVDGNAPGKFKKWTEAKSPRSAFMVQTKGAKAMRNPKYRAGDRLLAYVTVERSAHEESVFVISDSRQSAQLKESDIHSAVLLRFEEGDQVSFFEDGEKRTGAVVAVAYSCEPPQAWVKVNGQWPLRTVRISDMERG